MPADKDTTLSLLLISGSAEKASMLASAMDQQGVQSDIRTMRPSRSAVAYARRSGRYRRAKPHDFILFDFSEPDRHSLAIVADVAFGPNRAAAPVILLTSPSSECLLDSDVLHYSKLDLFAPTSLGGFVGKMRQHSRHRFLRALSVMSELGPILVRLPGFFLRHPDEMSVQQVA